MACLIERWCGYCFSFRKVEFIALLSLETSHSLQIWNTPKLLQIIPSEISLALLPKERLWPGRFDTTLFSQGCKVDFPFPSPPKPQNKRDQFGKHLRWGGKLHLGLSPRDWAGVKQNCEEMRGLCHHFSCVPLLPTASPFSIYPRQWPRSYKQSKSCPCWFITFTSCNKDKAWILSCWGWLCPQIQGSGNTYPSTGQTHLVWKSLIFWTVDCV